VSSGRTETRWGILGTGLIAHAFAEALRLLPDARLMAVASRTAERADAFAREFDVPLRFDRYESLADRVEVDVVYVATPHASHARDASLALRGGKAVLCEKPLTVNADEAERLIEEARRRRLFLMEAMWTRFIPAVVRLREWIASGAIGEIRLLTADLGWQRAFDAQHRLFNPELAGGALLDTGVYPVSFASMLLGSPVDVCGVMHPAPTGVDTQCAVSMRYASGALVAFATSFECDLPGDAMILGTEGRIHVHRPVFAPVTLTRRSPGGTEETVELPYLGNGYAHEAMEVMDCLRAGRTESDVMPLDESLSIMKTLDAIREPWGLRYAADEA